MVRYRERLLSDQYSNQPANAPSGILGLPAWVDLSHMDSYGSIFEQTGASVS